MCNIITGISCVVAKKGKELACLEEAISNALADGGIKITDKNSGNIGIFLGTTLSNFNVRENTFATFTKLGVRAFNPADFPRQLISYLGGCLSIKFGTKGAMSVVSSGQSSGLDALTQALFFLQRERKNIAIVIDLDESLSKSEGFSAASCACFVLEKASLKSGKKVYADILRIEHYFERKNENQGLCGAVGNVFEFCSSKRIFPKHFLSSQTISSKKYNLEEEALKCSYKDKESKLIPARIASNSSLMAIYENIKARRYLHTSSKKIPVSLFLDIGEETNSGCAVIRCLPAQEE